MSNYVLQIQLEGADKADAALDSLLKKVGSLSAGGKKMSFDDFLKHDPTATEKIGKQIGDSVAKGVDKSMKGKFKNILWESTSMMRAQFPAMPQWLKNLQPAVRSDKGLQQFINQRHAESGKTVDKDFWTSMFPAIKGDKSIQQLIDQRHAESGKMVDKDFWLKNFSPKVTRAPKGFNEENAGANLGGVQSLPDIGKILEDEAKAKKLDWKKIFTGLFLGVSNPYIGSRVLSDELGKKLNSQSGGIAGGLFGKGGIAGFSEIFIAFKAFKIGVDFFKKGAEIFMNAANSAAKLYSNALQNGMGLNFSIKRSKLAEIMGVSEQDVFRFGAQMAYLNPKLEQANNILAKTAIPLTEISWQWKILQTDLSATFAKLTNDAKPAIMAFLNGLDLFVKSLNKHATFLRGVSDYLSYGVTGNIMSKQIHADENKNGIPEPQAWMKQLPASSLEKMGLVTMGGSQNYQKDISKNTKEIAAGIKILIGQNSGKRQNSSFGMSPNTSQP